MNDRKALAVQVDERLAELQEGLYYHEQRLTWAADAVRRDAGQKRDYRTGKWDGTFEDAVATVTAGPEWKQRNLLEYDTQRSLIAHIKVEWWEGHSVWVEEGYWTRAFLVINSNGHVHKSTDCSTCFESTRYEWLTAYSGDDEAAIVEAAGETACTICYPSAPADILNRPASIQSKARAEREEAAIKRATVKAEREAQRKAKAPTASGEPLLLPSTWSEGRFEEIKTERTARTEWNSAQQDIIWKRECGRLDKARVSQERQALIEEALAGKYGVSPAEIRDQLLAKYRNRRG